MKSTNTDQPEGDIYPHLALIGVQILFGSLPVIGKLVLAVIPAISLVGFRVGITAFVLLAVQAFRRRVWLRERGDYWRLALVSVFGVTLNQLFFIGGLSLTKASNTSLLAVTIPIFTLIISTIAGTETLRARKVFGIILAAAGVVFLIDPRNASFSSQTTIGDIFIILNSLSYGIFIATSKKIVERNGAFRSMMWIFIFASLVCVPLGIYSFGSIELASIPRVTWWLILYISVGATAGPYLLNAFALSKVPPSVVAVYIYLQPMIGFILAVVFLGEVVDFRFGIAALCVFAGVYLTTKRARTDEAILKQSGNQ